MILSFARAFHNNNGTNNENLKKNETTTNEQKHRAKDSLVTDAAENMVRLNRVIHHVGDETMIHNVHITHSHNSHCLRKKNGMQ